MVGMASFCFKIFYVLPPPPQKKITISSAVLSSGMMKKSPTCVSNEKFYWEALCFQSDLWKLYHCFEKWNNYKRQFSHWSFFI